VYLIYHRASVYHHISGPQVVTKPLPQPRKNQVLIRVAYAGLNPVDAKNVVGDKVPHSWKRTHDWIQRKLQDKIIGFDFAGTVVEDATHQFSQGDKVFGTVPPFTGTCAEYIVAPLNQIYYKPKDCTIAQAAVLPLVGLTCYQCLQPHIRSDSNILILGASGGTGHVAVQIARCLGAKNVVGVCSLHNHPLVTKVGATHVIDYHDDNLVYQLQQHGPYDVVFDSVSSADPRDQQINYPQLIQDPNNKLLTKDYIYRRLGGSSGDWLKAGLQRTVGLKCWGNPKDQLFWITFPGSAPQLRILQQWVDTGKLLPEIQQEYSLEQVGEAFDAILSRRVTGKVVVRVQASEDEPSK